MSNPIAASGIPTSVDNVNGDGDNPVLRSKVQSIFLVLGIILIVYIVLVLLRIITTLVIEVFILGNGQIVRQQIYARLHVCCPQWFPMNATSQATSTTGAAVEMDNASDTSNHPKSKHSNTRMPLIELILPGKACTEEDIIGTIPKTEGPNNEIQSTTATVKGLRKDTNKQHSTISEHTTSTVITTSFSDHSRDGDDDIYEKNERHNAKNDTARGDDVPSATRNDNESEPDDDNNNSNSKNENTMYETESCTSHDDENNIYATQCSICLQEIIVGDMIYTTRHCNHLYHVECIRQWVTTPPNFATSRHNHSLRRHLMSSASVRTSSDNQNCSFNDIIINNDCPNCRTPLFGFDTA